MRPRSRPHTKRTLFLPTIREGTEETVRDLNDANATIYNPSHPVSSEDYFLSICHLAHPTFPTRDMPPNSNHTRDSDSTVLLSCHGPSDPLEYLYGHPNNNNNSIHSGRRSCLRSKERMWEMRRQAHTIPNTSSSDLTHQRKSSCPELRNTSPNGRLPKTDTVAVMEEERQDPGTKPSLISQWISDCRLAWSEARASACLLPTIAEI